MSCVIFFFFNDTATTEIYTLSLHDALPISLWWRNLRDGRAVDVVLRGQCVSMIPTIVEPSSTEALDALREFLTINPGTDRKSTRLNSSHANISYAVFCLKKKKTIA